MNKIFLSALITVSLLVVSCSQSGDPIAKKKAELQKLKDNQADLSKKILAAEDELSKLDTSFGKKEKTKLVAVQAATAGNFTHFIDLQGKIDAQRFFLLSYKFCA